MEFTDEQIIDFFDNLKELVLEENRGDKRVKISREPVYGHEEIGKYIVPVEAYRFIIEVGN